MTTRRFQRQSFRGALLCLAIAILSLPAFSSEPDHAKDAEACRTALRAKTFFGERPEFSSSTLIPVGELIKTMKDPFLAKLHVQGSLYERDYPTPGLAHMFRTASSAAESLTETMNGRAVRPDYPASDLMLGAAATEALMLDPAKQPDLIRDAVLIREGVVMIVPLLKKIKVDNSFMYAPIIVKGHQDLQRTDDLRALFAAWALARSFGRYPPYAEVYLKPMAKKRELDNDRAPRPRAYEAFYYDVHVHIQDVEEIHRRYIELISDPDALGEAKARRSTETMKSPWASYVKELLAEDSDLSMMPYPPTREQASRLSRLGYSTMESLAKLNVNSNRFIEISMTTGIKPEKLRYFVAHSRAATNDEPYLTKPYFDPFGEAEVLVHVDFEDMMSRQLRSGVYLFGAKIEDLKSRKKNKIVDEAFVWADELKAGEVADAWAEFIRFIKDNKHLKDRPYKVTVYSHHEMTKFHQEFDVVEDKPEEFTKGQRRSKYYWESPDGKRAKYIRNQGFFRKNKDISPQDVFEIMENIVDLYQFVLRNYAFPTYSNGLKHVIPYISEDVGFDVEFPDGQNGLESIEWAMRAYQTLENALFTQIEDYNRIDVDGNIAVARYILKYAGYETDDGLEFNQNLIDLMKPLEKAAQARRHVDSLIERAELLESILGRQIADLRTKDIEELEKILDRSEYLAARAAIDRSDDLEKAEKEQELQRLVYEFKTARKAQLLSFFERVGQFKRSEASDEQLESLADFFLIRRVDDYSRVSFQKMILLERMLPLAQKIKLELEKGLKGRMLIPEDWADLLGSVKHGDILKGTDLEWADARKIWQGLYFRLAFPLPHLGASK